MDQLLLEIYVKIRWQVFLEGGSFAFNWCPLRQLLFFSSIFLGFESFLGLMNLDEAILDACGRLDLPLNSPDPCLWCLCSLCFRNQCMAIDSLKVLLAAQFMAESGLVFLLNGSDYMAIGVIDGWLVIVWWIGFAGITSCASLWYFGFLFFAWASAIWSYGPIMLPYQILNFASWFGLRLPLVICWILYNCSLQSSFNSV